MDLVWTSISDPVLDSVMDPVMDLVWTSMMVAAHTQFHPSAAARRQAVRLLDRTVSLFHFILIVPLRTRLRAAPVYIIEEGFL